MKLMPVRQRFCKRKLGLRSCKVALIFFVAFAFLSETSFSATCAPAAGGACTAVDNGNGCQLGAGACDITADSNCQKVTNLSGLVLYVPAKEASTNWGVFLNNMPFGVSKEACTPPAANCTFDGQTVLHGASVTAYQSSSTTEYTSQSTSTTFGGSYSCPTSIVVSGKTYTFDSVTWGGLDYDSWHTTSDCSQTTLGTYPYDGGFSMSASGSVPTAANTAPGCYPGVGGSGRSAYNASTKTAWGFGRCDYSYTAPSGTCSSETRTCNDGVLSGSYPDSACGGTACPSTTKSWGSGCSGSLASTASTSATVENTATGYTGSATYSCDTSTGTWATTPSSQSCSASTSTSTSCPTGVALSWSAGGLSCSASTDATTAAGSTDAITDATGSETGSATFLCQTDGTWKTAPEASPAPTCSAVTCPTGVALSWSAGGLSCSASTDAATAAGGTDAISDATGPDTGSATFLCQTDGTWKATPEASPAPSCSTSCPSQPLSWGSCSGTIASASAGTTNVGVSDGSDPYQGSAQYTCNSDGTWSLQTGSTCGCKVTIPVNWVDGSCGCNATGSGDFIVPEGPYSHFGQKMPSDCTCSTCTNHNEGTYDFSCTSGTATFTGSSCIKMN